MASIWMRFSSPESPIMRPDGEIVTMTETVIGELRLPSTCPWWMCNEFDQWKGHTNSRRELVWEDFPIEEYLAVLYSKNRPIRLFKPTSPRERTSFILIPPQLEDKIAAEVKRCETGNINTTAVITPTWLRKHGVIFMTDIGPDTNQEQLAEKGYRKAHLSQVCPWLTDQTHSIFEPRIDPEAEKNWVDLVPARYVSFNPWPGGEKWNKLMGEIWGTQIETTGAGIPTTV